eukprot:SAG25_NODE_236_length_11287_cov_246.398999_5_plen_133_part_00
MSTRATAAYRAPAASAATIKHALRPLTRCRAQQPPHAPRGLVRARAGWAPVWRGRPRHQHHPPPLPHIAAAPRASHLSPLLRCMSVCALPRTGAAAVAAAGAAARSGSALSAACPSVLSLHRRACVIDYRVP